MTKLENLPSLENGWNRSTGPMQCIGKTPDPVAARLGSLLRKIPRRSSQSRCFRFDARRKIFVGKAKLLLTHMSKGAPGAHLTLEAKAALDRLNRQVK